MAFTNNMLRGRVASLTSVHAAPRPLVAVARASQPKSHAETKPPEKRYHPSPLSQAPPSTYAIVEMAGTQLFLEPGKWYTCNRLKQADVGDRIKLGRVLGLKLDGKFSVGQPYLDNVCVEAEILEELRGPKIIVFKMQPKRHYHRKRGHRQELTKFKVTKIEQIVTRPSQPEAAASKDPETSQASP